MSELPQTDQILTQDDLRKLRDGFDKEQLNAILGGTLPKVYPPATEYTDAIMSSFYSPSRSTELDDVNRERCIITLLAAKDAGFTLAIHIYIGLMLEIPPNEIAHILMLVGTYAGVESFTGGLLKLLKTQGVLKELLRTSDAPSVLEVYRKIRATTWSD